MLFNIHLQLFAEGAGEAGGEESGASFEQQFEQQFGRAPKKRAEHKTETQDAPAEGTQDAAAKTPETAETTGEPETVDTDAEFEQLIKGKYKDAYGKRAQQMINERFKNHNAELTRVQQERDDLLDALDPYLKKLGVDTSDLEAVRQAVMDDASNFRAAALRNNVTVEQAIQDYQAQRKAEKEAQEQQRRQNETQARAEMEQRKAIYDGWQAEAAEIRKLDPDFDLSAEIKNNPDFSAALDAGMSVRFAYNATHYDANMAKVAGAVERQTAINTANRITAGRARPAEGGLGPNAAARQTRTDYKNLPNADILDIFNKSLGK